MEDKPLGWNELDDLVWKIRELYGDTKCFEIDKKHLDITELIRQYIWKQGLHR